MIDPLSSNLSPSFVVFLFILIGWLFVLTRTPTKKKDVITQMLENNAPIPKERAIPLLQEAFATRDADKVDDVLYFTEPDQDYTALLLALLAENWHYSTELIVEALTVIKDPLSVPQLYKTATTIPEDEDKWSIATRCMEALHAIHTPEALEKLQLLSNSSDMVVREIASKFLDKA